MPPLSIDELRGHAAALVGSTGMDTHSEFITVLVGNALWWETMASIPYERRVLLLPQCLRASGRCPAELDEIGLLCEECGACPIGEFQQEAESLGYVVLVAEGTTVVTKLLEQGTVDAVVGVSCLSTLERSFPHMAADAIPGLAVPLLGNGCLDTRVDGDWVLEAIRLKSHGGWAGRLDIDALRTEVAGWFELERLRATLGADGTQTAGIALEWLSKAGKRWRPFLVACVYQAMSDDEEAPDMVRRLAVAVECFHKASIAHDDIEDDDDLRYGEKTLHREYGLPIALNTGDLLLGEGYRLIGSCGAPAPDVVRMLTVAADGHRDLSLGQGEELCWVRAPVSITAREVLDVFRLKTAPAFEVAILLGAIAGGADDEICGVLKGFSESLGIAYQIRDDIEDYRDTEADGDIHAMRPSLLLALACETADEEGRRTLEAAWTDEDSDDAVRRAARSVLVGTRVEKKAEQLLEHYKNGAIRALNPLESARLKTLLRRIVGRILR